MQKRKSIATPRDLLVGASMTLVAAACAMGLAVQGGMALWIALLIAAAIYAIMLSTHGMVRRRTSSLAQATPATRREPRRATTIAQQTSATEAPVTQATTTASTAAAIAQIARAPDPFVAQPDSSLHRLHAPDDSMPTVHDEAQPFGAPMQVAPFNDDLDIERPAAPQPRNDHAMSSQRDQEFLHLQGLIKKLATDTSAKAAPLTLTASPLRRPDTTSTRSPAPKNPDYLWLTEALASERVNVYLDPIQRLSERQPHHFEVSVRLLSTDGQELQQRDVMAAARVSGLIPQIDAIKLPRVARVARRIQESGQASAVMTSVSGESLADQIFRDAASRAASESDHGHLVLGYAQYEARAFGPAHWQALTLLADWGLRFALEEVVDLDMDFGLLKARGFAFVKLDATVLLEGMPGAGGIVPAVDVCRYLEELGLTLIAGRIENEWTLSQVQSFGAQFGQGSLFGAPRAVRADVVAADTNAA